MDSREEESSWKKKIQSAAQELTRGQDSATRLLVLIKDKSSVSGNCSPGPAGELLADIMDAFFKAQALLVLEVAGAAEPPPLTSEQQTSEHSSFKRKIQHPRRSRYRRADPYTCKTVLSIGIEDGYTWRKYGQKIIHGTAHQRSYYRCTHKHDRGCQATRQVQRTEDASMFAITYMGEHTCADATKLPTERAPCVNSFGPNITAKAQEKAPLSSTNHWIKRESDEEVLGNHSPCSASSEFMFQDFADYEGSAPLTHFMGVASNQYDVTSGFQSPAIEFDLGSLEMDGYFDYENCSLLQNSLAFW